MQMIEKDRISRIDSRRIIFFFIFIFMFLFTEFGREVYRPYIYSNGIFDFWIADTIGNFTGTITIIFFEMVIINPEYKKGKIFLYVIVFGLIIYELIQYLIPKNIGDWRDIVATLLAGLIALGLYELIFRKHKIKILYKLPMNEKKAD